MGYVHKETVGFYSARGCCATQCLDSGVIRLTHGLLVINQQQRRSFHFFNTERLVEKKSESQPLVADKDVCWNVSGDSNNHIYERTA